MPTPEELARINIDKQLAACDWTVQSRDEINLFAARGVAVREFPLETGEADYQRIVSRIEELFSDLEAGVTDEAHRPLVGGGAVVRVRGEVVMKESCTGGQHV